MERATLAQRVIQPVHDFQERAHELMATFVKLSGGLTRVGKYLLNPRIVPLLESKRSSPMARTRVDLDRIEAAPSCRQGGEGSSAGRAPGPPRGDAPFATLADWLELREGKIDNVRCSLSQAQNNLMETLAEPRDDGRNMVLEAFRALARAEEAQLLKVLGEKRPGGDETYLMAIAKIRAALVESLQKELSAEQYRRWQGAAVDPFRVRL
ncbi:MAG: hypothetical protein AB1486_33410 [Planctomycetota bacterium]